MHKYWVLAQIPQFYKYVVRSITVPLPMIELTHHQGSAYGEKVTVLTDTLSISISVESKEMVILGTQYPGEIRK